MNQKEAICEKAAERFQEGYNCAQSVLLTMFEHWDGANELVPKIATAFGGGIGRCGSICGALTGGVIAIGIKYGTNEPSADKRQKAYKLANRLYKQFEKQHGSVLCHKLIGYDLSNPDELKKARETKVFDVRCTAFIKMVIGALIELDEG